MTDAVVGDLAVLPFRDRMFDLAFSKYVFEHLDRPLSVMRELRRVLAPGSAPARPYAEPLALRPRGARW